MIRLSLRFSCAFAAPALVSLATIVCGGCEHSEAESSAPPPTVVLVSAPVEQAVVDYVEYTGRTEPAESVEIRARVTGFLNAVLF